MGAASRGYALVAKGVFLELKPLELVHRAPAERAGEGLGTRRPDVVA